MQSLLLSYKKLIRIILVSALGAGQATPPPFSKKMVEGALSANLLLLERVGWVEGGYPISRPITFFARNPTTSIINAITQSVRDDHIEIRVYLNRYTSQ